MFIVVLLKQVVAWRKIPLIADIVAVPADLLTPRRVAVLQGLGKRVVAYTTNTPQEWEDLLQAGVNGFITDYPRTLKDISRPPRL